MLFHDKEDTLLCLAGYNWCAGTVQFSSWLWWSEICGCFTSGPRMRDGLHTTTRSQVQTHIVYMESSYALWRFTVSLSNKANVAMCTKLALYQGRAEPNMRPSQIKSLK